MTDPRPDRAVEQAFEPTAAYYLPADDSPRRLRLAVALAAAVHALLLIAPLPNIQAESAEADKKVYLVVPVQRFKPPEPPPEEPTKPPITRVPIPDPDPTDVEPLRLAETLEPVFDLPPIDAVIDFPEAPPEPTPERPLPVGGPVIAPLRVEGPVPVYPELARRVRIECTVLLKSVIDQTGQVTDLEVEKPCPFGLTEAAVTAVERWRYRPATLNGLPVAVYMTVQVDFHLD